MQNLIEAAANGATDGMKLAINVAAMLIAFVPMIAMADKGFPCWERCSPDRSLKTD